MRSQAQEDRPVSLGEEVVQGQIRAERRVQANFHSQGLDGGDLPAQHLPRQPVGRDAHGHHPAGHRKRLEDSDV